MKEYTILGVRFEKMTEREVQKKMLALLKEKCGATVFTPNSQIIERASRDARLLSLINSAELLLPDGCGICIACRMAGIKGVTRVTGIDTAEWLLTIAEKRGLSVFLLGGKEGIAELAAKRLSKRLPALNICGTHHGYFDKTPSSPENKAVLKAIRRCAPDILFVCMGFPMQEAWIRRYVHVLPSVQICMGLGGSLDVWSGKRRRAPKVFRRMGMEWLWRCMIEPKRIKDLCLLPKFLVKARYTAKLRTKILRSG